VWRFSLAEEGEGSGVKSGFSFTFQRRVEFNGIICDHNDKETAYGQAKKKLEAVFGEDADKFDLVNVMYYGKW
jgi:hypothetical protein